MLSFLVQIAFGWPAIIGGIATAVIGISIRRPGWLYAAAAMSLGPAYYLGSTPRFAGVGFLAPFLFIAAGLAAERGQRLLAAVLVAPFCGFALWLAGVVLSQ